ncbi:hypothetical protein [Geodermatophilus sp. URMC 64]
MARRRYALVSLVVFLLLSVAAAVVSGSRPALEQGLAPIVVQVVGYLFALAGAAFLLAPHPHAQGDRLTGGVVLGALAVLVALEVAAAVADAGGGADIGGGLVRLVCLLVVVAMTVRLAAGSAALRRTG